MPIIGDPVRSHCWSIDPHAWRTYNPTPQRPHLLTQSEILEDSLRLQSISFFQHDPIHHRPRLPLLRSRRSLLSSQLASLPSSRPMDHRSLTQPGPLTSNLRSQIVDCSTTHIADEDDPSMLFLSPLLEDEESDVFMDPYRQHAHRPITDNCRSVSSDLYRARLEEKWESIAAKRLLQQNRSTLAPSLPSFTFPPRSPPGSRQASIPSDLDSLPDLAEDCSMTSDDSDVPASPESDSENSIFFSLRRRYPIPEPKSLDGWDSDRQILQLRQQEQLQRGRSRRRQGPQLTDQQHMTKSRMTPVRSIGRRHSWSEPRLWTVYEEESEVEDDTFSRAASTPGSPSPVYRVELNTCKTSGKKIACKRRASKTVHWNERVQVVEFGI